MDPNDLLLPPSSRLVHIGPHKTGTTSVQTAFHVGRKRLKGLGVHYAGAAEQPLLAALAVAGGGGMRGEREPRPEDWTDLVEEVRAAGEQRVVLSSEFLCYADDEAARRVVTEIDGGPVHVVITLRSVAQIAPSQWQQYVQNGLRVPYMNWLDGMFRRAPYDQPTPSFWRRHTHGDLVRRWADAVGPENLTVVVADESNPDLLLRTFEGFVGLPEGSLKPTKNAANRSLARGEIELVRLLNTAFADRGWSDESHVKFVRHGASRAMKFGRSPAPGETRLTLPDWALERAAQVGAETVETIRSTGVRVVGDLDTLAQVPEKLRGDEADLARTPLIPVDAAAHAAVGALGASGRKGEEGRLAAILVLLGAMKIAGTHDDLNGMPQIPADIAARAVLGVIDANGEHGFGTELAALPRLPVSTAAFAVLAAVSAAEAGKDDADLTRIGAVRDVLGVTPVVRTPREAVPAVVPTLTRRERIDKRPVGEVGARDLLRVIAQRARNKLRR